MPPAPSDILVEALAPAQLRPAWPLVRAASPDLTLPQWLRHARPLTRPEGNRPRRKGIMVARRRGHAFLCGLVCFEQEEDLAHGPVLTAGHFVAMDIIDPAPVFASLLAAMEERARLLGCSALRSVVHRGQSDLTNSLLAGGHAPEAELMLKQVLLPAAG